jgi:hypothetical protein
MTHVKNQHYVPQFLLRNFSSRGGLIWCFDKLNNTSSEKSIRKIATEEYFYDTTVGQPEGSLEYLLSKAESAVALPIQEVVKHRSLTCLSADDFVKISLFIALQMLRTKSALQENERYQKILQEFLEPWRKAGYNIENEPNRSPREVWLSMFDATPEFAEHISRKIWFLIASDKMFYISDNPVVLQNRANKKVNRGTLGINSDGIEIFLPISDSLVICLLCERTYGFLEGKTTPDYLTFENLNALQILQSDRYIFSSRNNFTLL